MSLLTYKKFKIIINGDSPKENGLQYGDVVIRKYLESSTSYYSVLYVTEIGTTPVTINGEPKTEKWFIGSLIYGDDPLTEQPLDFTRITSLSNSDRMGALYLTSVDNDAPYLDIVDRIGIDGSINYPRYIGAYGVYDKYSYAIYGTQYFSSIYTEYSGSEQRIIRITKNATPIPVGESVLLSIPTLKGSYADQKVIISYKYRTSDNYSIQTSVSDGNGDYELMSSLISSTNEFKSALNLFSVSNIHTDSYFKIDLSQLSVEGSWIEISDLNIIPLNALISWENQTKTRVGKLSGISDPVFGALRDYGAYIQRIYASKDVNISGTLTAGDKNGFGATFYAGKIHKNVVIDSMNHDWELFASEDLIQDNPVGIGKVFKMSDMSLSGSNHRFTYNTQEWYQSHIGDEYTFSAWFKSGNGTKTFSFDDNDSDIKAFSVGEEWRRIQFNFIVGSDVSNNYCFVDISGPDTDNDFYICGMQVEKGEYATAYQPTDGTITPEDNSYGVWMARGGIGGTIQNPLLKLTNDGWIKSRGDRFYITPEGNAYFEGQVEAGSGKIGGWNISQNSIFSGVEKNLLGSYTDESGSITIGSLGVRSYRWRLENDGSGAFANGKINWNSDGDAFIGQWTIDSDSIYVGIKKSDPGFTSSGITIHSSGAIRSMYSRIESDGKLYATNADISGKITASLGEIGTWKIDSDSIYSGAKALSASSFSLTDGSITLWSAGAISSRYFRLGTDGKIYATNVDINGKITASSGLIGAWSIDSNSIYSGTKGNSNSVFTSSPGSITLWSEGAITSRYFRISTDGVMIASNVDVSGKITASSGSIGGWVVDSSSIYSGVKSLDNSSFTLSDGSITIWGSGAISSRYFRLGVDGKIYASNVDISGKIVASSGSVGSWNIDFDSIYSGTKALDNGSNTVSDGSITIWSSGSISARYFKLLSDGKIYASNADISGKISASSGVIGGWTINELSISGGNTIINSTGSIANGSSWALNSDGSSSFAEGKISFTSSGDGYIGGWKINTNSIYSGTKALNDSSYTTVANSMTIWSSGAISAFNFRVGTDGKLYATNADISGKITASSGSMGLWNIGDSLFTGTENNISGQFTSAIGSITIGSNGIRGYKWRFESDGSGSIAGDNIYWDAAGLLTISGNASTASQLKVAVELWGNSFNGSEPIYGPLLIKNTVDPSKSVTLSVDIDGNLKIDGNIYATGEVSAYGAGSGTGGGGGLISSVLGSAGLGGSYLDSDLTNTFNAYTINLINTNLTSALGRIGTLETSTPNVAWGIPTSQYTPLTINSVTRNLSLDGHTHSYLPLSGGNLTGALTINGSTAWHAGNDGGLFKAALNTSVDVNDYNYWQNRGGKLYNAANAPYNYYSFISFGEGKYQTQFNGYNNNLKFRASGDEGVDVMSWRTIWHDGNDGAGSGLDADLLDGKHDTYFLYRDGQLNVNNVDFNTVSYTSGYGITMQPIHTPNFSGATNNPFMNYGQMVNFDGGTMFPFRMAFNYGDSSLWVQSAGYQNGTTYNYSGGALWKKIAFTTDNVASATKLATTRTIWGQNFNGEGNVSGSMTSVTSISMNGSLSGVTTGNFSGEVQVNVGGGANNALYLNGDMRFGPDYSGARTGLVKYNTTFDGLLIDTWSSGKQVRIGGSKVVLGVGEGGQLGNVLIGTSVDAGYKLDVNGTSRFSDTILAKNLIFNSNSTWGNLGSVLCTWGNNGGYPTLYGSSAERWIMHINPHISYVQNGIGEYTGAMNGATIRFAGNTAGSIAWDLGVGCNSVGADKFSIGRNGTSFFKIANDAHAFFDGVLESTSRIFSGFDSGAQGSISCSNWFRTNGATGWYNQTYGGGMTMEDYTYVKVSHNKSLWVNGNIVGTGEVTAYSASDVRLKTDVTTLRDSLRIIELLNPVSYKWNSIAKELNPMKSDDMDYGLIAQELECVMPELVHTVYGQYKSVDYVKIIPHLICAIKQLKSEIDMLKS